MARLQKLLSNRIQRNRMDKLIYSQRLAILLPEMALGGAQHSMIKLAKGIRGAGIPVDLVLGRPKGGFMTEVPETVRVIDLKANHIRNSIPALVKYLKCERPTVLLASMHANNIAILARYLAASSTRVYVSERSTPSIEAKNNRDIRIRWMPILSRFLYKWADGVIAVSQGVARDLTKELNIPNRLIHVIYNPIITPELRAKALEPLEHAWFQNGEPPVILAVGRLSKPKDFGFLIRAFAQVRQSRSVRLIILGEGENRLELEKLTRELGLEREISLPGFARNPYPYMVRAAGFVLSSRWEGLPGVLIEALYCRAPIVATNCPSGPEEILKHGEYGRLVPVGDVLEMSKAMTDLIDGRIAHPPVESWLPYELDSVINQYLQVLF